MKLLVRRCGVIALAIASTILLGGCTSPERTEFRVDHLEELVDEFDAKSVAEVLCEYDGGEAGALTQLNHSWVLSGATSFALVEQRLAELGYDVTMSSDLITADRDGVFVAANLVERPGSRGELEAELEDRGCTIPHNGVVLVTIAEDGSSDVGASA